ncbi:MAG: thioesterase family protein [Ilumatobacteraceae bacterium]|nr:thioesterase family protein [Ilumatobacteraceae bacterium]
MTDGFRRPQHEVTPTDALFESGGEGTWIATKWSQGPWNPEHCHGAPPAALLVREVEQHSGAEWQLSRITIELQRPVPVGRPLTLVTEIERPGKKISVVGVSMRDGEVEVAKARALRIRTRPTNAPAEGEGFLQTHEGTAAKSVPVSMTDDHEYGSDSCEHRFVTGGWDERGRSVVWIKLRLPVVVGEEPSGAQRVAAAVDFGNGVSARVEHLTWLYINPDLTIHFIRPPEGEWICLDARSEYGNLGGGLAASTVHDDRGPVAISAQSLLVEPR